MADIVKKVVVENVPKLYESGYTIRYRIVSEDRNRVSHWSPIHTISRFEAATEVDGEISFISARQVSASWEETNTNSVYEIFLKWEGDDNYESDSLGWTFARTVSSPTYSTLVPFVQNTTNPAESVRIWVQQPTATKEYTEQALIYTGEDTFTS
jgi:hypothetical protein